MSTEEPQPSSCGILLSEDNNMSNERKKKKQIKTEKLFPKDRTHLRYTAFCPKADVLSVGERSTGKTKPHMGGSRLQHNTRRHYWCIIEFRLKNVPGKLVGIGHFRPLQWKSGTQATDLATDRKGRYDGPIHPSAERTPFPWLQRSWI